MDKAGKLPLYCESLFEYKRNMSRAVPVGSIFIGGDNPIRLQSMTTTDSLDTEATANQCIRIAMAGGELVRITTQGRREAINLEPIKKYISDKGFDIPLVADIHFNPNAALLAAERVEKVRINPGNFADGAKKFSTKALSPEEYLSGLEEIEAKLLPLLDICRDNGTALRIGANHGSLSDRIMTRYGDTALGMVESCMEFLRICRKVNFENIVLSIKSSNTRVMVQTVRLLAATMRSENMNYPLHLGVTEAGSGEDGRIKSAVGIGALLADGLGDTIRVSLTEEPEEEIPVARHLKELIEKREGQPAIAPVDSSAYHPYDYVERKSHKVGLFGGGQTTAVVMDLRGGRGIADSACVCEAVITDKPLTKLPLSYNNLIQIIPHNNIGKEAGPNFWPLYDAEAFISHASSGEPAVLSLSYGDLGAKLIKRLREETNCVILLTTEHANGPAEQRAFFLAMAAEGLTHPVIIHREYAENHLASLQIEAAADTGLLFLDGFGDGLSVAAPAIGFASLIELHFGILQASRVRFSRTEYISCPGCGRTLFDLQTTTKLVRARTSHLKGLKIAIMGCIVNGIGEMADADYGYVGAGPGKISLYKNRELVLRALPADEAVERLVELIKEGGDWREEER
jgi:(E)-4-hydroxy-3-methylbut-2-enyl-diphosphate synthase